MSEDTGTDSAPSPELSTRTFLFADIRGYTRFTREQGDEAASALTAQFAVAVRAAVADHGCELLELRGDEALCVFGSARRALAAAVELQRRLRTAEDGSPALPVGVGAGLDAGEAVPTQDGYRGGALNLAARLCSVAAPGQILASEAVAHLAGRVDGLSFARLPPVKLKGLGGGVGVLEVVPDPPLPPLPAAPPREPSRPRLSRVPRSRPTSLAMLAVIAALAVGALWLTSSGSGRNAPALRSNSLVELDPASGRVVADVPLSSAPGEVVSGGGSVWVGLDDVNGGTISRIDPEKLSSASVPTPANPISMAVGFGALWVYDASRKMVAAIDLNGGTQPQSYRIDTCPFTGAQQCLTGGIAIGEGGVWIGRSYANAIGAVWKRDPTTFRVTATVTGVPADRLVVADGALWTFGRLGRSAAKVDLTTNVKTIRSLPAAAPVVDQPGSVYAFGQLWLVTSGAVFACDFSRPCATVTVDSGAHGIAATADSIWVASSSGAVVRINPFTRTVVDTYRLGHLAAGITVYHGHVWVGITARV